MTRIRQVLTALRAVLSIPVEAVSFSVDDPDPALQRLADAYALSPFEVDVLLASLLPLLDDRIGDALVVAAGRRVPHVGVVVRALAPDRPTSELRDHLARGTLWRRGLLRPSDEPMLERPLLPSIALLDGLEGRLPPLPGCVVTQGAAPDEPALHVRPSRPTSHALRHLWEAPRASVRISLEGEPKADTLRAVELWAVLRGLALVVDAPHLASVVLPPHFGTHVETHLLVSPGTTVDGLPRSATWHPVKRLHASEQRDNWLAVAPDLDSGTLGRLANFTFLRHETLQLIADRVVVSGGAPPTEARWIEAIRAVSPPPTARFSVTTEPRVPWDRLVLPERPASQLDALVQRVQHRSMVQGAWGMASPDGRGDGVVGVLHGDSGTGKTFAVEAMATRLGMPVMRVDLSRVVSKYIGETEKHLSELFDRAEGFRALLMFDEADSLFGKRTGVKDAHDRYANIETNYLLQRLELFDGLAILTTNLLQNLDEAFLRRLHYVVYFPNPDARAQLRLWQQHLPAKHVHADVDLERLARAVDLVGGDIRNAATEAAYRAASAGGLITHALLVASISDELQKKGKSPPTTLGGPDANPG